VLDTGDFNKVNTNTIDHRASRWPGQRRRVRV
jgi:hypothetical protein